MHTHAYPILEFDSTRQAVIEPRHVGGPADTPEHAVVCFFQDVITRLVQDHRARVISRMTNELGTHPLYEMEVGGRRLAVFHPGVGAPLAAAVLEEVIAAGCRKFIACGGAGVLDPAIAVGHLIVPAAAVRDEGTSYHYLPPAREVLAHPDAVVALESVLQAHNRAYLLATTWTTDAYYRETPARVLRRRAEGCVAVEMEAAAFFAVAQFRGVPFAQLLYGGDDVSGIWDSRAWTTHAVREELFWLAAEACLRL